MTSPKKYFRKHCFFKGARIVENIIEKYINTLDNQTHFLEEIGKLAEEPHKPEKGHPTDIPNYEKELPPFKEDEPDAPEELPPFGEDDSTRPEEIPPMDPKIPDEDYPSQPPPRKS